MLGAKGHTSVLGAAILASVAQTDAPSRGNELLSVLSQLKHWNVRISEFDRHELLETSVIGARQFEQG
jgi:hypothetical protein